MPKQFMDDSYVNVYHGPRRGGKTGQASVDCAAEMINGKKVFANYPISFDYEDKYYESQWLIYDELLKIDKPDIKQKYKQSVISWDETSLWLFSRNSMAQRNKYMSLVIQLIGKLEMSFYFTTQFLSTLDKNIKLQMDSLVFCQDMSFKFRHLERGSFVNELWMDISGRNTGDLYEYSREVYQQTFYFKPFWGIYPTDETFDILSAQQKVDVKKLNAADFDNQEGSEYQMTKEEENKAVLRHLINELVATGQYILDSPDFWKMAFERGFTGSPFDWGKKLGHFGIQSKRSTHGLLKYNLELALAGVG